MYGLIKCYDIFEIFGGKEKENLGRSTHLLQFDLVKANPSWQTPFHDSGMGPNPSSLKLFDSGHIPDDKLCSQ